ncbi:hypothetical protein PHO31112_03536 [Pandoraea horticolens]|uniref:Uncharacterized protein n=1 Tax=Pandoraea horticolens TaxID=2508298 RepID=A0A5E4WW24_9BURK|nr:hypothetical protein PHO31112_03536 [Pandoraea horticolens]
MLDDRVPMKIAVGLLNPATLGTWQLKLIGDVRR